MGIFKNSNKFSKRDWKTCMWHKILVWKSSKGFLKTLDLLFVLNCIFIFSPVSSEFKITVYINTYHFRFKRILFRDLFGASFAFILEGRGNSGSLLLLQLACAWKITRTLALVVGRKFLHGCLIRNSEMKLREGNFRMDVRKTSATTRHFKLGNGLQKEKLESSST